MGVTTTDDDEKLKLEFERISEILRDNETYDAFMVLQDKGLSPDEIYQTSFYIDIIESGERG